jgi:hypothetical protein
MKHPGTYYEWDKDDLLRFNQEWIQVAQLDIGDYSWTRADVWAHLPTGRLYWDADSGCSCYGPYDQHEDLRPLDNYITFRDAVGKHFEYESGIHDRLSQFLRAAEVAMKGRPAKVAQ